MHNCILFIYIECFCIKKTIHNN